MRVYLASPYQADTPEEIEQNVQYVLEVATMLIQAGYTVYVPHLVHYLDLHANGLGVHLSRETWLKQGMEWLKQCDAILVLGISHGVEKEIELARSLDMPIYFDLRYLMPANL